MTQEVIDRITLEALLYEEALDLYCKMINLRWEKPLDAKVNRITVEARARFERRFNQFTKGNDGNTCETSQRFQAISDPRV